MPFEIDLEIDESCMIWEPSKYAFRPGYEKGYEKDRKETRIKIYAQMVLRGSITHDTALQELNLSAEEFFHYSNQKP